MGKRRGTTAAELLARLEADPAWVAARDAREARQAERAAVIAADEAGLLADLRAVGVSVASVSEFVNDRDPPPPALPVLVRHLDIGHLPAVREGVLRALTYPGARATAFEALRRAYRAERDDHLRWVTANALAGMADLEEVADLPGMAEYAALFRRTALCPVRLEKNVAILATSLPSTH